MSRLIYLEMERIYLYARLFIFLDKHATSEFSLQFTRKNV